MVYIPKGTRQMIWAFGEYDNPVTRQLRLVDEEAGEEIFALKAHLSSHSDEFTIGDKNTDSPYAGRILKLTVSEGADDFMIHSLLANKYFLGTHGGCGVAAVLCPDRETAEAVRGGALHYDDRVFWHPFQMRLYKYLLSRRPKDFLLAEIENPPGFTLPNGIHKGGVPPYTPEMARQPYEDLKDKSDITTYLDNTWINLVADRILYAFEDKPLDPRALDLAILSMYQTFMVIGTGDHAAYEGWNGNMGYSMTMWEDQNYRIAWRLMKRPELPQPVRDIIIEGLLVAGDRLAFARTIERCNGNAFTHVPITLRYIAEASRDELQLELAKQYMDRFLNGGWGPGTGVSPSGDVYEFFAHTSHYGTYNLQHLGVLYLDMKDEQLRRANQRMWNFWAHVMVPSGANPTMWSIRHPALRASRGSSTATSRSGKFRW